MKTLVGWVIVGFIVFASVCHAEVILANSFKIVLTNGDNFSCNEMDISVGCKLSVNDKFVDIIQKPIISKTGDSNICFFTETIFVNYKFPINNVSIIEYR